MSATSSITRRNSCTANLNLNKVSSNDKNELDHKGVGDSVHFLECNPKPNLRSKKLDKQTFLDTLIGSVYLILLVLFIISISTDFLRPSQPHYKDCYQINIKNNSK